MGQWCLRREDVRCATACLTLLHVSSYVPSLLPYRVGVRACQVAGQSWFGGGCDLTPSYLFEEDAAEFHSFWQGVCDKYHPEIYPEQKAWCDK